MVFFLVFWLTITPSNFATVFDENEVLLVQEFGNWLISSENEYVIITENDLQYLKIADVAVIQQFGDWLDSCTIISVEEDSKEKFDSCLVIKQFLRTGKL